MQSFQWHLKRKPFIIFSIILIIYTVLQLLISYHMIEIEFGDHHKHESHKREIHKKPDGSTSKQSIPSFHASSSSSHTEFESTRFEGCDPIAIDYEWGVTKFPNQRIACLVLSLYPRNKILMQFIGETYGPLCDALYFILDDSKTHWFNTSLHSKANRDRYHDTVHFKDNQQVIDAQRNLTHLSTYFGGTVVQLNLTRPSHHKERNTWEKVHRMYTYFYVHHLADYDWFVRIDDDVLVSMVFENSIQVTCWYLVNSMVFGHFRSISEIISHFSIHRARPITLDILCSIDSGTATLCTMRGIYM